MSSTGYTQELLGGAASNVNIDHSFRLGNHALAIIAKMFEYPLHNVHTSGQDR
jgi:hypothetical protein